MQQIKLTPCGKPGVIAENAAYCAKLRSSGAQYILVIDTYEQHGANGIYITRHWSRHTVASDKIIEVASACLARLVATGRACAVPMDEVSDGHN